MKKILFPIIGEGKFGNEMEFIIIGMMMLLLSLLSLLLSLSLLSLLSLSCQIRGFVFVKVLGYDVMSCHDVSKRTPRITNHKEQPN